MIRARWISLLIVWACLYAWRPWAFGFYSDDWSFIASPYDTLLVNNLKLYGSRPLYVLVHAGFHAVAGSNHQIWQAISAVAALLAAASFAPMARRVLMLYGLPESAAEIGGLVGSGLYLVSPSLLGVTAWPTLGIVSWATTAFNASIWCCFAPWPLRYRASVACGLFVTAGLIYEAYWLTFLFVLAPIWLLAPGQQRREIMWLALWLTAAQFALIGYNRGVALLNPANVSKGIYTEWPALAWTSTWRTWHDMEILYTPLGRWLALGSFALSLAIALLIRPTLSVLFLGAAIGIVVSVAQFAAAGYAITLLGLFGRTTTAALWWLALASSAIAAAIVWSRTFLRQSAVAGLGMLFLLQCYATLNHSRDFAASWQMQQDILNRLPARLLLERPRARTMLALALPPITDGIGTFRSSWDVSAAIRLRYPELAKHLEQEFDWAPGYLIPGATVHHPTLYYLRSGSNGVEWGVCDQEPMSKFTSRTALVLWAYPTEAMKVYEPPFSIGCEQLPNPEQAKSPPTP